MASYPNISDYWHCLDGCKEDVFIIGSGDSLRDFDLNRLNDKYTIGLNKVTRNYTTNFLLYSDEKQMDMFAKDTMFPGTIIVHQFKHIHKYDKYPDCTHKNQVFGFTREMNIDVVESESDGLYIKNTVATGAIFLAWKLGAHRIFLLGCDACSTKERYYWYEKEKRTNTPKPKNAEETEEGFIIEHRHKQWIEQMQATRDYFDIMGLYPGPWPASGIYNCSSISQIKAFEKIDIERALNEEKKNCNCR